MSVGEDKIVKLYCLEENIVGRHQKSCQVLASKRVLTYNMKYCKYFFLSIVPLIAYEFLSVKPVQSQWMII